MKGFSVMAACLLLVAIIIIPDLSSQRRIPRQKAGSNGCVKYRHWHASGVIAVCRHVSFQCLCNIPRYGFPKCLPVYEMRTYNVINGWNRTITLTERVTVNCKCDSCEE
ncbi:uncharacterized protein LOC144641694 [Oculina patagonica]